MAPLVVVGSLGRKQSGATKVTSAVTGSSSNSAPQRILSPETTLAFPFIGDGAAATCKGQRAPGVWVQHWVFAANTGLSEVPGE